MYPESDLLMISALQHIAFCERQCALIHIEQAWKENRLTAEGRLMHERVHGNDAETRGDVRIVRGLRIRSLELGIAGIADIVEFHRTDDENAIELPGKKGRWRVFPVEYKRGKPKKDRCDEVQLCAQAMCLEEMLYTKVNSGALFYGAQHKRNDILIDESLRSETIRCAKRLHELIDKQITPVAVLEKRCKNCSLADLCFPNIGSKRDGVSAYVQRMIDEEDIVD